MPSLRFLAAAGLAAACSTATPSAPDADAGGGPVDAEAPPAPPPVELGRHAVAVLETRRVVPSPGLPEGARALSSNNNLDVVRHEGRVYLAWRTAPDHFASPAAVIYVVSSADELQWTFEAKLAVGSDLREPRFLSLGGRLFLYMARLGVDRLAFEPKEILAVERASDGTWSQPSAVYEPRFIAWRTKVERGTAYMTAYLGGENIYLFNGKPLEIHLLTSTDGRAWTGVDPAGPAVLQGGGSESDFTLGDDGTLYAVVRNEAGDESGWGSKICRAEAGAIGSWSCTPDPKKYDSPLMFWHDGEAYLVARRNVTADGKYDLGLREYAPQTQTVKYQAAYSDAPKRCALWRWVQAEKRIAFVLDLPSRGDTCFASVLRGARESQLVIYDYSSDTEGPDVPWSVGQRGPTYVYRHVLDFARR